ncbi:MAG: sigma-54 dependent transcriptional regulator [Desulfobulbaceae bacterium]|nr:sigma-54 dependent transcriptional regulator [Desulfobulbaceae bacterium]
MQSPEIMLNTEKANRSFREVSRLAANNKAFFDLMPECLFIIRDNCEIERMNDRAIDRFGDVTGKKCYEALFGSTSPCGEGFCPMKNLGDYSRYGDIIERKIHDDFYVEYTYVPFEGYLGHGLVLVVMRDITKRKMHEFELASYQSNIERVLHEKIDILKESEKIREQLACEVNILQKEVRRMASPDKMVGESRVLLDLREMIYQAAGLDVTVLITGESGTGKELVADLVYQHSNRVGKPFLKLNCASVSESLLESDLFGYEKGAFTGATACRKGKFEIANGGTLFLDEIGDISPKMQSALLRVLQNGEVSRVGGGMPFKVDVRIIAATNVDLVKAVEKGTFRRDLFYRLNVITLHQAPLRERSEDIVQLAAHFLKKYRDAFKKDIDFLSDTAIEPLLRYPWPGNIRELENVIQRAVLHCKSNMITPDDLQFGLAGISTTSQKDCHLQDEVGEAILCRPLRESAAAFEKKVITAALKHYSGQTSLVVKKLDVGKTALYEKIKRYGINPKKFR